MHLFFRKLSSDAVNINNDFSFCAIDFETANNSPLSAVVIGVANFENGVMINSRSWLLKPYSTAGYLYIDINGISPEMVADKPQFHQVWEEVEPFLQDRLVIAHNAEFDIPILEKLMERGGIKYPNYRIQCTLKLSRRYNKYENSHALEALCECNKIPYGNHDAEFDAISAGCLFYYTLGNIYNESAQASAQKGRRLYPKSKGDSF
jgi:DNA polymerase-3 subunit epsilon